MANSYPIIRQPLRCGCCSDSQDLPTQARHVLIFHPGYAEDDVPLLVLIGRDSAEGLIDFDFVFVACATIANNRYDGWLSESRDATGERITSTRLLRPGNYFFHVERPATADVSYRYPIVSTFRSWKFPISELSSAWTSTEPADPDASLYSRCALTDHTLSLDKAHIIPDSEGVWFFDNAMRRFGNRYGTLPSYSLTREMEDATNIVNLRADIHRAWDSKLFTFVPKKAHEDGDYQVVAHCFGPNQEVAKLYHNVPLHPSISQKPREYLLARLAWTLLPSAITDWLMKRVSRNLLVLDENGTISEKILSADECRKLASLPPRSESPRKRKQNDAAGEPQTEQNKRPRFSDSFDSGLATTDEEEVEDPWEERRGRPRRRRDSFSNCL